MWNAVSAAFSVALSTGTWQKYAQVYCHAVLESESWICRLLQSLSEVVPSNISDICR